MGHGEWLSGRSCKLQAKSCKPQASSSKLQATSSNNAEISSQLREGHGPWPLDISSWIEDPGISFTEHGPRVRAKINVCLGWATCHEIWWGENLSLFPLATFNSIVKKCLEVLYPNRSGMPSKLRFSIRFQMMEGVFFLRSWYNFRSDVSAFFKVTTVY